MIIRMIPFLLLETAICLHIGGKFVILILLFWLLCMEAAHDQWRK